MDNREYLDYAYYMANTYQQPMATRSQARIDLFPLNRVRRSGRRFKGVVLPFPNLRKTSLAAASEEPLYLSREALQYWDFLLDLVKWATEGYPRDRLEQDLRLWAARP